jgi:hypothetical protein
MHVESINSENTKVPTALTNRISRIVVRGLLELESSVRLRWWRFVGWYESREIAQLANAYHNTSTVTISTVAQTICILRRIAVAHDWL